MRPLRGRRPDEGGAAVADFAMVSALLAIVFVAVLQLGLVLHVRNTLTACASEGARFGARSGAPAGAGADRAAELITRALSAGYARDISTSVETVDGVRVEVVRVRAPLPIIGLFGVGRDLQVTGRAFEEDQ